MTDPDPVPEPTDLVKELKAVQHQGASVSSLRKIGEELPGLLSLKCTQPAQGERDDEYGRAEQLRRILLEASNRFEESSMSDAFVIFLGLSGKYEQAAPTRRRELFARVVEPEREYETESFLRRHQERYLESFVDRILQVEREARLRQEHGAIASGRGVPPSVAVNWMERFEYYSRIGSYLSSLEADILTYIVLKTNPAAKDRAKASTINALYHFGCVIAANERFKFERGGLWVLSSHQHELEADEHIYQAMWHPRLGHYFMDWIAGLTRIREGMTPNLVDFKSGMDETADVRDQVLDRWQAWVTSCSCPDDNPNSEECSTHAVVKHSEEYRDLIADEWRLIAGWYTSAARFSDVAVPVETLIEQYGLPAVYD